MSADLSLSLDDGPQFIGPVESHVVVINGRRVPMLSAHPLPSGRLLLCLDDRFSVELSIQEAQQIVPFIAHSIAVGMGYASFPESGQEPVPRPVMPLMSCLG
jgi:hypothetical protein